MVHIKHIILLKLLSLFFIVLILPILSLYLKKGGGKISLYLKGGMENLHIFMHYCIIPYFRKTENVSLYQSEKVYREALKLNSEHCPHNYAYFILLKSWNVLF